MGAQCPSQNVGAANQLFSVLIQAIFAAQCSISPPEMWPKDYGPIFVQGGKLTDREIYCLTKFK